MNYYHVLKTKDDTNAVENVSILNKGELQNWSFLEPFNCGRWNCKVKPKILGTTIYNQKYYGTTVSKQKLV